MSRSSKSPAAGIVCAPQSEAAYEAARVLDDGGNAADALVTGAFVQGVVDPHRSGVGGFGSATLYFHGNDGPEALAVDFHGLAGGKSRSDIWENIFEFAAPDGFGYVVKGKVNDVGYQAVAVPGMVAGVAAIHSRFGSMTWGELIERAVPYAEEGFVVSPELAEFWIRPGLYGRVSTRDRLALTVDGQRICFRPDGSTYQAGEVFRQRELAETYRRLAAEGAESFYRGELARQIAADWEASGALVTGGDLESYQPKIHAPLRGRYRDLEVVTSPLPGGGVALLQTLRLLESKLPLDSGHNSPDYIHEMALVLQGVWRDRLDNHGDPAFGGPSESELLAPEHLDGLLRASGPPGVDVDPPGTTQLTILDGWGNMISFSHSLGYNSGVFSPGLGVLFNNCMSAFDPRPGRRNSIAPGKARTTAVAETLLLYKGKPVMALGSPGAARITAGIAQVIVNAVDFKRSVAEAVVEPRFDAYGPGKLLVECRFPCPLLAALEARGWEIVQSPKPFGVVGRVYAVGTDPLQTDTWPPQRILAGVDPGQPGAAFRQRRNPNFPPSFEARRRMSR